MNILIVMQILYRVFGDTKVCIARVSQSDGWGITIKGRSIEITAITQTSKPRSKGLLIWLIVSQVLAVASLLIWLIMAGMSVIALASGETPQAWPSVITIWLYPILPIVMAVGAWIAYMERKNILSAILSGLTFAAPVLVYIGLWLWFTFAVWLIEH